MDCSPYYQLGKAAASCTTRTKNLAEAEAARTKVKNHQLPWRYGQARKKKKS